MRFFSIFSLFILIAPIAEAEQMPWAAKLTVAIKQENASHILAVLSEGKDLNMVLPNGRSPIAIAAVQSSPEVIDILVVEVHHVHLWQMQEHAAALDCHIVVERARLKDTEKIKENIKAVLAEHFSIEHSTLEIETTDAAHQHAQTFGHGS